MPAEDSSSGVPGAAVGTAPAGDNYRQALAQEKSAFENCEEVHALPAIFHYWSQRYLRPAFLPFGFDSPEAMFAVYLEEQCRKVADRAPHAVPRFVSIGSGNCDLEVNVATQLRDRGHELFIIDCVNLNPAMLARGRAAAEQAGVARHFTFCEGDVNRGIPDRMYDAAIANQSLHHILNLETLFEQVKRSLNAGGAFIVSDMIGRNGHQRWPEALAAVHEFWRRLPPSYRLNRRLNRYEELFEDLDCSLVGFEGIRAQDILPLLLRDFHFQMFVPFANIVDPFLDRTFGPNFDAAAEWDRNFIDEIHRRDHEGISSGALTPTHMLAILGNDRSVACRFPGNLSPGFCVRKPDERRPSAPVSSTAYHWRSWPHPGDRELEIACARLADASRQLGRQTEQIAELESEIVKRTAWARDMERQLHERTAWALSLNAELERRTAWAHALESELAERTASAQQIDRSLAENAPRIESGIHAPRRFGARLFRGVCRRAWQIARTWAARTGGRLPAKDRGGDGA